MRNMTPAHHIEANKRANGHFDAHGTFLFLDAIMDDLALVQAYQDYQQVLAEMAGMSVTAGRLLAITRAEHFSEQLPALKVLFRKRLDNQ